MVDDKLDKNKLGVKIRLCHFPLGLYVIENIKQNYEERNVLFSCV